MSRKVRRATRSRAQQLAGFSGEAVGTAADVLALARVRACVRA